MGNFKINHTTIVYATLSVMVILLVPSSAQIGSPCTTSAITSFTPCFNFITGSSANGGSPTSECCRSFKTLMTTSMDCVCLVLTANVPIPLPVNRTLALSLPRVCNNAGVPMQCKASGAPLPAPGPVLLGPSPPPPRSIASPPHKAASPPYKAASPPQHAASPLSPRASRATTVVSPTPPLAPAPEPAPDVNDAVDVAPAAPPPISTKTPAIRPVLTPSSSAPSYISWPPLLLGVIGAMLFKLF